MRLQGRHKFIERAGGVADGIEGCHGCLRSQFRDASNVERLASCSGKTVRKSSRTRPSSTRAITGGRLARRRMLSSSALRSEGVNAIRRVGKTAEGAAPPPITESPSTSSNLRRADLACELLRQA